MGDFSQIGSIPTLHRLGRRPYDDLEAELLGWSTTVPMALAIPTLYEELERRALDRIVEQLAEVPYLSEVIIGIDGANAEQFALAQEFFSRLPMHHRLLWNDGPRLQELNDDLAKLDIAPAQRGKGRNVWYCLGYFLASARAEVVGLHDADILTYSKDMVARLLYPVVNPDLGYAMAKGYYYRSDGTTLNGRVARLLVAPLLDALTTVLGPDDYLRYLAGFRYPLAGESALRREVVSGLKIPSDWGVEIGMLGEVYRRYTPRQICQVDIADGYDHKHQPLSADDPDHGLHKMAIDIGLALFRRLAADGAVLTADAFSTIKAAYRSAVRDLIDVYHHDAVLNGLQSSRHLDEETVDVFARAVDEAGTGYLDGSANSPFIDSWSRVHSAMPDVFERLKFAVEADNAGSD